jgi:RNA polymerase sigma-70 factor (ECF subfamily)
VVEQVASVDDSRLVEALRDRDERAFEQLTREYNASLLRVAQIYVTSRAVAEEVVQETWLGVLKGIERFEARSSLKTWIFRILTNIAKTRAQREGRTLPFSALERPGAVPEPAVDPERFLPPERERTETNQRVLLHRARSKVRRALENYVSEAA